MTEPKKPIAKKHLWTAIAILVTLNLLLLYNGGLLPKQAESTIKEPLTSTTGAQEGELQPDVGETTSEEIPLPPTEELETTGRCYLREEMVCPSEAGKSACEAANCLFAVREDIGNDCYLPTCSGLDQETCSGGCEWVQVPI